MPELKTGKIAVNIFFMKSDMLHVENQSREHFMILTEKHFDSEQIDKRAHFVTPEKAGQPLVLIERLENGHCRASCKFQMTGTRIRNRKVNFEDVSKAEPEQFLHRNTPLLFEELNKNHSIKVVYTIGQNKRDDQLYHLDVLGSAIGSDEIAAYDSCLELFLELDIMLTSNDSLEFDMVDNRDDFAGIEIKNTWRAQVIPYTIEIEGSINSPIGFLENCHSNSEKKVIISRGNRRKKDYFDALVKIAEGCKTPVVIELEIHPFRLTATQLELLDSVRNSLGRIGLQAIWDPEIKEPSKCEEDYLAAEKQLTEWLTHKHGFKLGCYFRSEIPIPSSILSMVCEDLFSGIQVNLLRDEDVDRYRQRINKDYYALDLSLCFNGAINLPACFPEANSLESVGINRVYSTDALKVSEEGIIVGLNGRRQQRQVKLSDEDRGKHTYIIGATGTGKSTLLCSMIVQDIKAGKGVGVIDAHGDLYHDIIKMIPPERMGDVVLFDPTDMDYPVGLNYLEKSDDDTNFRSSLIINELLLIFDRIYNLRETGGPMFENYFSNAVLLLLDSTYPEPTLMDILRVFEDERFREYLKNNCSNRTTVDFFEKQAERVHGEAGFANIAPYITSKLVKFTNDAIMKPIIGQPRSTVNFRHVIDNRKILLVNLSKGMLSELGCRFLGMMVLGKILDATLSRANVSPDRRTPFNLYIDEFQNFVNDSISTFLSESRKYGITLTLANQNLNQLSSNYDGATNILESVLGNVGNMLFFRMGVTDAGRLQKYTTPQFTERDLSNLPGYHVLARILVNGSPVRPFIFRTVPANICDSLTAERRTEQIIHNSRLKYATPYKRANQLIDMQIDKYKNFLDTTDDDDADFAGLF
jgi:TraM recognition site of TraD and TraG/Helicase HerA, central domain